MPYGAAIFDQWNEQNALDRQIRQQEADRKKQEREHSAGWWKRGIGQGILGALPGIVTLNPVMAAAGAAGGFGGEAVNHAAFKDKHPEIAGNAAALASLGSGAASKGLFQQAGEKAGLSGMEHAAAGMGNSDAYAKEMQLAKLGPGVGGAPNLAGPAMPGGAQFDHPALAQSGGATHPAFSTETMGPSTALANPQDLAYGQFDPEELQRRLRLQGFVPGLDGAV